MEVIKTRPVIATWWGAEVKYGLKIAPVRVVAITAKTITYLDMFDEERRRTIHGIWDNYYPTFEEAKAFCIRELEVLEDKARRVLGRVESDRQILSELTSESFDKTDDKPI
jgi:hypothetical protein